MNLTITNDMTIKFVYGGETYTLDKMILNENGIDNTVYDGGGSPAVDYSTQYFTIESLEDGNTITFNKSTSGPDITYYWSTDGGSTWTSHNATDSQTINTGDKLLMKCTCNQLATGSFNYWRFSSTKTFNVYGNIMSLLYGDNFVGKTTFTGSKTYQFNKIFYNCTNLISAGNLVLPATTLANCCYYNMFSGCTSLTTAPVLLATTLAGSCYSNMFQNCTSLTTAPALPATTLANYCYYNMFYGCTSLTTAPVLPATTLTQYCYSNIFYSCRSLTSITCLATNISASNCLTNWVAGVASSGTFYRNASMTSWPTGTGGIPSGWTVVKYTA